MNNQKKNTQKYLSKKLFFFLTCIEKKIKKEKKNYKYLQVPLWKLISEGKKILRYF